MMAGLMRWAVGLLLLPGILAIRLMVATPVNPEVGFSLGGLLRDIMPGLVVVALPALAAAWLATDARGVATALAWLGGRRDEARAPLASRALASASRAAIAAGLILSIAAMIYLGALLAPAQAGQQPPSPRVVAMGFTICMLAPLWALLVGRCWLGSHAAQAALLAGERPGRVLRGWSEMSVPLLMILIPALVLLMSLTNYDTISR